MKVTGQDDIRYVLLYYITIDFDSPVNRVSTACSDDCSPKIYELYI